LVPFPHLQRRGDLCPAQLDFNPIGRDGDPILYIGVAANPGHSSRLAESGRLVRRMSHRVDPAAIAEEART
jgi:hypothetical protein